MNHARRHVAALATIVTATAGLLAGSGILAGAASAATTFIGPLNQTKELASTVPANGDVNPYGVAVVPQSTGNLHQGNVLVSNFNNAANTQGTGTTIVQVTPGGAVSQFAGISDSACPGGVGLTTALVVLRSGWVIVGSLPTQNGSVSGSGCLIVLDSHGVVRETLTGHGINGPWDMTALDLGGISELFVTNVLNGTVAAGGKHRRRRHGAAARHHQHPRRDAAPALGHPDRIALPRDARQRGPGHRPDRRRPRPERHPVRRRHAGQQDRRHPQRGAPPQRRRRRPDRVRERRPERRTRPGHRAQR